ncbi:MAG: VOC family protein [Acidobacteria bacterium]|nr:MAG: VOC family protein [Acidobacteriota bacterium]
MQLSTHLNFNGQCEAAFKFYEKVLGGKITFRMTWGEMPGAKEYPPETHKLIMHTSLTVDGQVLMGADSPPGRYQEPKGITISVSYKDRDESERIFNALAEDGKITMPFDKTFWSAGFGMCVDQFGIPWMVNTEAAA